MYLITKQTGGRLKSTLITYVVGNRSIGFLCKFLVFYFAHNLWQQYCCCNSCIFAKIRPLHGTNEDDLFVGRRGLKGGRTKQEVTRNYHVALTWYFEWERMLPTSHARIPVLIGAFQGKHTVAEQEAHKDDRYEFGDVVHGKMMSCRRAISIHKHNKTL